MYDPTSSDARRDDFNIFRVITLPHFLSPGRETRIQWKDFLTKTKTLTNLYTNYAALVHDLLDDASVLADHLADQVARHLQRLLAVLEHGAGFPHRLVSLETKQPLASVLLFFFGKLTPHKPRQRFGRCRCSPRARY